MSLMPCEVVDCLGRSLTEYLTEGHKHVPLLLLGDATASVTDRKLHKLLARVIAGHRLEHDSDAAIRGKLG